MRDILEEDPDLREAILEEMRRRRWAADHKEDLRIESLMARGEGALALVGALAVYNSNSNSNIEFLVLVGFFSSLSLFSLFLFSLTRLGANGVRGSAPASKARRRRPRRAGSGAAPRLQAAHHRIQPQAITHPNSHPPPYHPPALSPVDPFLGVPASAMARIAYVSTDPAGPSWPVTARRRKL